MTAVTKGDPIEVKYLGTRYTGTAGVVDEKLGLVNAVFSPGVDMLVPIETVTVLAQHEEVDELEGVDFDGEGTP